MLSPVRDGLPIIFNDFQLKKALNPKCPEIKLFVLSSINIPCRIQFKSNNLLIAYRSVELHDLALTMNIILGNVEMMHEFSRDNDACPLFENNRQKSDSSMSEVLLLFDHILASVMFEAMAVLKREALHTHYALKTKRLKEPSPWLS